RAVCRRVRSRARHCPVTRCPVVTARDGSICDPAVRPSPREAEERRPAGRGRLDAAASVLLTLGAATSRNRASLRDWTRMRPRATMTGPRRVTTTHPRTTTSRRRADDHGGPDSHGRPRGRPGSHGGRVPRVPVAHPEGLLHGHVDLHRVQGLRGRVKEWNRNPQDGTYELLGSSYDNTGG